MRSALVEMYSRKRDGSNAAVSVVGELEEDGVGKAIVWGTCEGEVWFT